MRLHCQTLAKAVQIDNDHFMRTTDKAHREAVQYFWVSVFDHFLGGRIDEE